MTPFPSTVLGCCLLKAIVERPFINFTTEIMIGSGDERFLNPFIESG
jgi:hypothetical protein